MLQASKYVEIKNAAGQRRALLSPSADGLKDSWIDQRLNAECTLSFALPLTCDKWGELTAESRLVAGGREFVLLHANAVDTERSSTGEMWGRVTAQESYTLLAKSFITVSNDHAIPSPSWGTVRLLSDGVPFSGTIMGSAESALRYLLAGTGWSVGVVDVVGGFTLITDRETVLQNIAKVQEIWGGFLVWDSIAKTLSLRSELTWGTYEGYQVRYAKNLKDITRTADNDVITRLVPFGEDDIGIASVNGGVPHLDNFSFSSTVYTGVYRNQGISDPAQLRTRAQAALDKLCRPRLTYRVGLVDLRTQPGHQHETFSVGSIADVIDEDLGITIRARILRHKYNVIQPWECELEIGEPEERLSASLAQALDAAKFVEEALKPNPATGNLLKGFISTFATRINSANGKLVWDDSSLQAIEIDANGNNTGARVRITPGGIGISQNHGQTYVTAMTGAGVLANTVIVNELYALATDDGFTKLMASGLNVFDDLHRLRVTVGWWMDGLVRRFGLHVRSADGTTTMLDDRGILQTWQEGRTDNVQPGAPMTLHLFVPSETRSIRRAILRLRLLPFRTYSTGAEAGGGGTSDASSATTTGASSSVTTGASSSVTTGASTAATTDSVPVATTGASSITTSAASSLTTTGASSTTTTAAGAETLTTYVLQTGGSVDSTMSATAAADAHNHGIPNATLLRRADGGEETFLTFFGASHSHSLWPHSHATAGHTHGMAHDHGMAHTHGIAHDHGMAHNHGMGHDHGMGHTHTVPVHAHDIVHGIFTGLAAAGVTVAVNGIDRTSALGGPFNADQNNLNIAPFLNVGQWNTVALGSTQLGRVDGSIFIQALMGV